MKSIGVVIADQGAAIVSVQREPVMIPDPQADADADQPKMIDSGREAFLTTDIERLPFDLAKVTARVKALDNPDTTWVIDGDGLGSALWTVVGGPDDRAHWILYSGRGVERQVLVDNLVVAVQEGRFHFAPNLVEQSAMSKAMVGYRRQVRDDGVIGSELVVALLLAIQPVSVAEGWFAYA